MSTTLSERLERKFPWVSVPHLLTIVAGLQVLVYILGVIRGPEIEAAMRMKLGMDAREVMRGEVWRLLSYVALPIYGGALMTALGAFVLHITGQYLEGAWGTFRLTVFFFATALLVSTGLVLDAKIFGGISSSWEIKRLMANMQASGRAPYALDACLGMLLGLKCPNLTFRWMYIVPVKASIFGWLAFAGLVWGFMAQPGLRLAIGLGVIPFAITALPQFYAWYWLKERVWRNRPAFEAAKHQFDEFFSKCHTCGRTDTTDPQLLFRVAGDGQEYCEEHLPGSQPSSNFKS